jgi:hypothetical protein
MAPSNETNANADSGPRLNMLAIGTAVPANELPKYLQEQLNGAPTVSEVRALDADERDRVLAAVDRAVQHYRKAADSYRARGNPAQQAANDLESFLEAARQ